MPAFKDLTGQKINNWIIKEFKGFNKHGASTWLCECDCSKHTERIKDISQLKQIYSCGCCNIDNLKGKTFNRWKVVSDPIIENNRVYYMCECSCEEHTIKKVRSDRLTNGCSKSCGCYALENRTKHGMSHDRIYKEWYGMVDRCTNPNREDFKNYGGRGIKVCEEWINTDALINFRNWAINNGYADNLSIERIDVNGNYEPSNCTWITMETQSKNKRNTIYLQTDSNIEKLVDASSRTGVKRSTILRRYNNGIISEDYLFCDTRLDNTSGIIGVSYSKDQNNWRAYISIDKKRIELGRSKDKTKAIKKRLQFEYDYFGNDAPQIHLFEEYGIGE